MGSGCLKLSCINNTWFLLNFFNEPEDILSAFQPYYQTAELADVSDLIFDLSEKLRAIGIFTWQEVEQFCDAFFVKSKSNAAIANICNFGYLTFGKDRCQSSGYD